MENKSEDNPEYKENLERVVDYSVSVMNGTLTTSY